MEINSSKPNYDVISPDRVLFRPRFSIRLLFNTLLLIGAYVFIFTMSAQTGEISGRLSARITAFFVSRDSRGFELFHTLLRKAAHVSEFACLFILWYAWMQEADGSAPLLIRIGLPWCVTALSALLDEGHQLLVAGRSGCLTDVLIDLSGVTILALILLLYRRRYKRE